MNKIKPLFFRDDAIINEISLLMMLKVVQINFYSNGS